MGMMNLLGQHGQPQDIQKGLDYIRFSADNADENAPQGAYVRRSQKQSWQKLTETRYSGCFTIGSFLRSPFLNTFSLQMLRKRDSTSRRLLSWGLQGRNSRWVQHTSSLNSTAPSTRSTHCTTTTWLLDRESLRQRWRSASGT